MHSGPPTTVTLHLSQAYQSHFSLSVGFFPLLAVAALVTVVALLLLDQRRHTL